ncbi:MAG: hypothetical protein LBT31_06310 [Synergistaceae bacterium]|nr:hypothetical protein [Synergistaceae bacterium]
MVSESLTVRALVCRLFLLACILAPLLLARQAAAAGESIDFTFEPASIDLGLSSPLEIEYKKLEGEEFKPLGNPYLVWTAGSSLRGGLGLMLTCAGVPTAESSGRPKKLKNIQLLLVRMEGNLIKPVQRFKLGDGAAPRFAGSIFSPRRQERDAEPISPEAGSSFMITIIRDGNNTEAFVFTLLEGTNGESGLRISEPLRINRSFPSKMNIDLSGTLEQDCFIDIRSVNPDKSERLDLREAAGALIEDNLYQLNARPIPSMRSLACVRNGWEGEDLSFKDGRFELNIGLTLITPSRKQLVDVTAVLHKDENGKWAITDYAFEPFLPYRSQ